jgi:formylglycine-generating enzyme
MAERTRTTSNALVAPPLTVAIPGGCFQMGSNTGRPDEHPVHAAEVAAFRMAITPVTVRQYAEFLSTSPTGDPPPWWSDPDFSDPEQPVVGVSWFDAVAFAAWLAASGDRWRLPTEAEWERAALGGLEGAPTAWGAMLPPNEVPEGPLRGPWRVGMGTPNAYGLRDMGTIVHEWCLDVYRPYEAMADVGKGEAVVRRSSRGGSWRHRQRWSSPSARSSLPPDSRYADYGFRLLREI